MNESCNTVSSSMALLISSGDTLLGVDVGSTYCVTLTVVTFMAPSFPSVACTRT